LSKSEVARICAGLDAEVDACRSRPLDPAGFPYVSLDALYHKVREGGRVVSMATLIAIGISATGERSVLGVEVAAAGGDEGAHWLPFLRSLTGRGPRPLRTQPQPGCERPQRDSWTERKGQALLTDRVGVV
jgi:putative transposase